MGAEIKPDSGGLSSLWSTYDAMDQQLFGRRPPDGFPDVRDAWTNTASMLYRWRLFNGLLENSFYSTSTNTGVQVDNATLIATTAPNNTPQSIVDFWVARILGRAMDDPGASRRAGEADAGQHLARSARNRLCFAHQHDERCRHQQPPAQDDCCHPDVARIPVEVTG